MSDLIEAGSKQKALDNMEQTIDVTKSKLNVEAEEFIPYSLTRDICSEEEDLEEFIEFNAFACVVEMSQRPHEFEDIFEQYAEILVPFLEDDDSSEKLARTLMKVCINEPNCRYIGVKLAQKLNRAISDKKFMRNLFDCTENKYSELFVQLESVAIKELENFSLYVGELYVQFENDQGGRYKALREAVTMISDKLLESLNEKHFFIIGLLMKLVGQSLHVDCSNILEELVRKLSRLRIDDTKTRIVIDSVVHMHNECWHLEEKNTRNTEILTDVEILSDPVLYGPDGSVMSLEESSFLLACLAQNKNGYADESKIDEQNYG